MSGYAHPEVLVDTAWAKANIGKPGVKFVEVDVDTQAYSVGHIPGAIGFNWQTQLQDQVTRDILSKAQIEELLGGAGISPTDTIVLYGDNNNWFAAYAFWLFKIYGHKDVRLINGGRVKWLAGTDLPLTEEKTATTPVKYTAPGANLALRARVMDVMEAVKSKTHGMIDVRSPDEYSGKVIAPPGMTETAQRGGHIPGAKSVPWGKAVNPDGTFKTPEELTALYVKEAGLDPAKPAIAYCRIGERSSHTWFVLQYLLGIKNVRNYDGSWTEYGSMVGMPIEK